MYWNEPENRFSLYRCPPKKPILIGISSDSLPCSCIKQTRRELPGSCHRGFIETGWVIEDLTKRKLNPPCEGDRKRRGSQETAELPMGLNREARVYGGDRMLG